MSRLNDIYNFGLSAIKIFRPSISVYIIISRNFIKITNLENEKYVSANSIKEFSTSRLLIADTIIAEKLAKDLLSQVCSMTQLKTRTLKVFCQPLDVELGNLSPVETMIFTDFAFQIGGRQIKIIKDNRELTLQEINNYA
jgi:hypothetical protein